MRAIPLFRRPRLLALAFVSGSALATLCACQALLGLDDATIAPPTTDAAGSEAGPGLDGSMPTDGGKDSAAALTVSIAKPIHLFRAGTAMADVTLTRGPSEQGPVEVKLSGLPANVTADALVIAAGATKGVLTLRATNAAAFGVTSVALTATDATTQTTANGTVAVVVRALPGAVDTSFVDNTAATGMELTGLAPLPDGKVIVAGRILTGAKHNAVVRMKLDGTLDSAFGAAGRAEAAARSEQGPDVVVDATGSIFVSGLTNMFPPHGFYVARFDASGKPDTLFAGTSTFQALYGGGLVAKGGYVYVAAQAISGTTPLFVGRATSAGFDPMFGTAGFRDTATFLFSPRIEAVLPDDRFLLVAPSDGTGTQRVLRLKADVTIDSTFGNSDAGGFESSPAADNPRLALMSDGRIAVTGGWDGTAGTANGQLATVAMPNGTLDGTFTPTPAKGFPQAIVVEEEDRIVIAGVGPQPLGSSSYHVFVHRVKSHGEVDPLFNTGSPVIDTRVLDASEYVRGAAVDPYRRLFVVTTSSIKRYWL